MKNFKQDGVMRFDLAHFKSIMPQTTKLGKPLYEVFTEKGEYCLKFKTSCPDVYLIIRTSIDPRRDISRANGDDSIRLMLVNGDNFFLLKNQGRWITRIEGWADRLLIAMTELNNECRQWAADIKCRCGENMTVRKSGKKAKNPHRVYATCECSDQAFRWLQH